MSNEYVADWAVFNEVADRMIENIDFVINHLFY